MPDSSTSRITIGWREWLSFPDLGIPGVKAKIDTGARSSALHTHDYEIFEENGVEMVRFHLHPLKLREQLELTCVAPVHEYREVKDSGGHTERRPFIRTRAKLGSVEWDLDLSLTNREGMKFRMLLGRAAVADLFLINPGASYLASKTLRDSYE